jgi:osmotically-inducible protein OsmY
VRRSLVLALPLLLGVSAFATEAPSNATLKLRIRRDLTSRRYLDPGWVRIRVERGCARISGRVPDEPIHRLVLLAARNVEGVESVTDAIAVDASLSRFELTPLDRARVGVANLKKVLAGDPDLGDYDKLAVTRTRRGVVVRGDVSSPTDEARISRLLQRLPALGIKDQVVVRRDASRRAPVDPVSDEATLRFAGSVTAAITSELGVASTVTASVERRALVLRGVVEDVVAHDLAVEVARTWLRERHEELARIRARSGELTRLLGGDPGAVAGETPQTIESYVIIEPSR